MVVVHSVLNYTHPEANAKAQSSYRLNPGGSICFCRRYSSLPGNVLGSEGSNSIADVVRAVSNRHDDGGADLGGCPEMLDFVVELRRTLVNIVEAFTLVSDDVLRDPVEEHYADGSPDTSWMSPRKLVDSPEVILALLPDFLFKLGSAGWIGLRVGLAAGISALLSDGISVRGGVVFVWFLIQNLSIGGVVIFVEILLSAGVFGRIVVWHNGGVGVTWPVEIVAVLPEKRSHWDMPDSQTAVLLDESVMLLVS